MFFLASGAAAAGKTTVARQLAARVENLICHDHDEKKASNENLRCQQLEDWIQLALRHEQAGQDFLLTTPSPLGELLACPSAPKLAGISATLLDCSDPVRIQRMRNRGFDPRWPPSQHVLNWASWHRMHAWDPQWEQDVIVGNGTEEHVYGRWTSWQQTDERWQVTVIDTTQANAAMMVGKVAEWVSIARKSIPPLAKTSGWWE